MLRDIAAIKYARKITLFYSDSSPEGAPLIGEVVSLSRKLPNLKLELFSSSPNEGFRAGRITDRDITEVASNTNNGVYYICGSQGYSGMVKDSLLNAGVPSRDIMSESFTQIDKQASSGQAARRVMKYSFLGFLGLLAFVASGEFIRSLSSYSNSSASSANNTTVTTDDNSTIGQNQTYTPPTSSTYTPPSSRAS